MKQNEEGRKGEKDVKGGAVGRTCKNGEGFPHADEEP